MRRIAAAAVTAAMLLAACGGSKDDGKKASPTTKQTTATSVTSGVAVSPLTGLPDSGETRTRPALVVKIDNYAAKSYPQFGIASADIVVCEGVEGGITRLMAIFQSKDASIVGPIRSARSSDLHLAVPLDKPLFAYSGTNGNFQDLINRSPLIDLSPNKLPSAYHRDGARPAPYNLFSGTDKFYAAAPDKVSPAKPLFFISTPEVPASGDPMKTLSLHWKMPDRATETHVSWTFEGGKASRVQEGQATVDGSGAAIAPRNIVVLFVEYPDSGERDRSNSIVPEAKLQGVGEAWVIRDGLITKGTWTKPGDESPIKLTDGKGRAIGLLPGQTWVELPAPGNASLG